MPSVNYMVNAMSMSRAERVLKTIQKSKRMLVEHHGGECLDCGFVGPPFIYDFDHRDPTTKSFRLASKKTAAYHLQLAESLKCDLVCANCHRMRTHRQRCAGCTYCTEEI